MGRTLLQMIQTAQRELGLFPVTSEVVTSTSQIVNQMYGFIQSDLEEIRTRNSKGWTALQFEYNIAVNPPISTLGVFTLDSRIVTGIPSVAALGITIDNFNAWAISSTCTPPAARIASIDSDNQITMTMEATASSSTVGPNYIYDMFGNIIYDMFGSPILGIPATVSTTAFQFGQDTYPMPDGFEYYQDYTWWDRTNHWMLIGPDSPQIDQWHRSGIVATGPRRHFRQLGPYPDSFRLWPPPFELVQPIQIVFEYMSRNAVKVNNSNTVFSEYFQNDADTCLLNDRALIMGIKWRFWEQKGMNWLSKRREWENRVDWLIAIDGGSQTLSLTKRVNPLYISGLNAQDGYFPGPGGSLPST